MDLHGSLSKAKLVEQLNEYGLGYTKEELYGLRNRSVFHHGRRTLCKGEDVRLSKLWNI